LTIENYLVRTFENQIAGIFQGIFLEKFSWLLKNKLLKVVSFRKEKFAEILKVFILLQAGLF
jgi:hypothetical protein